MHTIIKLTVGQLQAVSDELTAMHYQEVPFGKGDLAMELDWDLYKTMEVSGYTLIVGAFNDESNLVGYIGVITSPMLHHKGKFLAATDCFYVHPDYRHTGLFAEMLSMVEEECKKAGSIVSLRVTTNTNFAIPAPVLNKLGYEEVEVSYGKEF